jgi:predicted ATP-dependent endonuclease of OLD family
MRIKKVRIKNFRSYKNEVTIDVNDLTVFVGKNDIGKSTVLEALDIFFNEFNKGVIRLDKDDVNKSSLSDGDNEIVISVVFENLPTSLVIDTANETDLASEYLLNQDGDLEIIKKYSNGGKDKVFINAFHPTKVECKELLTKKITELRTILESNSIECEDRSKCSVIRRAIWNHYNDDLQNDNIEIDVTKEDAKKIWDKLNTYLPLYTLFQSDRKNSDSDSEVQDPLQFAVEEIFKDPALIARLNQVAREVEVKLKSVAENTLEKLNEMNPEIAESLNPVIPPLDSLKWSDVFKKVSIAGDEDIPINKRGSGVKRLILLNFFRAEAERRRIDENVPSVVYAIEEPETSQHTAHQRTLLSALLDLSSNANTQVFLTTHSPVIVKELAFSNLKLIKTTDGTKEIIDIEQNQLPYPSLNEVNYSAFGEVTEEYHNELFEHLKNTHGSSLGIKPFDQQYFQALKGEPASSPWLTYPNEVTIHTHVRNQIHHRADCGVASRSDLSYSIAKMREFISES